MLWILDGQPDHAFFSHHGHLLSRAGSNKSLPPTFPVTNWQIMFAHTFLIATPIFQVIALLVISARIVTKAWPKWRFKADDWIIFVAFVLMSVMFGLQYTTQTWAFRNPRSTNRTIPMLERDAMLGSIAFPFWAWATGLVKISIGCMLLRFQKSIGWRLVIFSMILLNVVLIGFAGVAQFVQCIPYASIWDFSGKYKDTKQCWDPRLSIALLYVTCVCNIISDVVFSLMPLTFLGQIRRPLREKVVVGALMALGLVASGFSVTRLVIQTRGKQEDPIACITLSGLLICLEVQTSLIAACVPTLRSSSRHVLSRMGLLNESEVSKERRGTPGNSANGISKRLSRRRVLELNEIDIGTTIPPTSRDGNTSRDREPYSEDEEGDESQYTMDPVTGRIVRTTGAKVQSDGSEIREQDSWTFLNLEWSRAPSPEEEIGIAR